MIRGKHADGGPKGPTVSNEAHARFMHTKLAQVAPASVTEPWIKFLADVNAVSPSALPNAYGMQYIAWSRCTRRAAACSSKLEHNRACEGVKTWGSRANLMVPYNAGDPRGQGGRKAFVCKLVMPCGGGSPTAVRRSDLSYNSMDIKQIMWFLDYGNVT